MTLLQPQLNVGSMTKESVSINHITCYKGMKCYILFTRAKCLPRCVVLEEKKSKALCAGGKDCRLACH